MLSKNKLTIIVSICVLIALLCFDQTAFTQPTTSTQKATSKQKTTSVKKVKPVKKGKYSRKTKPAQKETFIQRDWMLTGYGVKLSPDTLGDTLTFNAQYEDSYIAVLALAKRIYSFQKLPIDFEMEAQIAKHFGEQNHFEFNLVPVVFRWKTFPWDKYVDTSFAAGAGISYALETPEIEEETVGKDHASPKLLGYLMFEFSFALPDKPQWCFVARVHHRSGANGLFDGRLDASNAVGFGIKYVF